MHWYEHTIIVGGTGMLRAASVELASISRRLTSVARTKVSLRKLDAALPSGSGVHHQLQLDWSNPDGFLGGVVEHIDSTEPPGLVVAWIHDDNLTLRLASRIAQSGAPFRFFHVIGSARANPSRIADSLLNDVDLPVAVHYHQVILGARGTGGGARWLTDQEISSGVLDAIKRQQSRFVVGALEWYQRY